ncbi:hypothetical protein ACWEPC_07335 [Nonomuraea sp. NPDC004297]
MVDGEHYAIGGDTGGFRGHGGRHFDIEWFDGRRATTQNLWHQGTVPPRGAAGEAALGEEEEGVVIRAWDVRCYGEPHESLKAAAGERSRGVRGREAGVRNRSMTHYPR